MRETMNHLLGGQSLTREAAEVAMARLVDGQMPPEQVAGFLIALRLKKETIEEISGFVDCLRKLSIQVQSPSDDCMDVCGTGGDGSGTFNVSSTVAFVLAAAGQPVAKHGNRSVSSRSGSFDVVEALGLRFETDPVEAARCLKRFNLGLLFAPAFHPSLKAVSQIRRNLGVYTVFNALGPLLNPAQVKRQLVGVYSPVLLEMHAQVLRLQGSTEAMVVHGDDGLDEISLCAPTQVAHLREGRIDRYVLSPEEFGFKRTDSADLQGGDAQDNARIIRAILGGERGPKRDLVLMNASAALRVGGKVRDFREGVRLAEDAIDSGRALCLITEMRERGEGR